MPNAQGAVPNAQGAVPTGNTRRFSGFADLYDGQRPAPPARLGPLLASYAGFDRSTAGPVVVDLGSGTGLSTRWAARWAAEVIGVEPNADMRRQAEGRGGERVRYVEGTSSATGLAAASADVVLAVQAMHWMEPDSTLAEVGRLLRPGGVFAVVDADWPPVCGLVDAESAWQRVHRRIRVLDARVARGQSGADLRRPIEPDDPDLRDDDTHDPHRNRLLPDGVRSWSKAEHLARIEASGRFAFTRELLLDEVEPGDAARFVALMRSQGSYQTLLRSGLDDELLGMTAFEASVERAFARAPVAVTELAFAWRVRLGVRPFEGPPAAG